MYVSLIGSDQSRVKQIGEEVEKEIKGNVVTEEEVVRKKQGVDASRRAEYEANTKREAGKDAGKSL